MSNTLAPRRRFLQAGLAWSLGLSALPLRAHEFFAPNLTVIHPWTRASAAGATSAIVSMNFEDVTQADHLIGAQTPVAEAAELGGAGAGPGFDFLIAAGRPSALSEDAIFLRLLGLKLPLLQGREYPMTLVFANAGALKAALLVDFD